MGIGPPTGSLAFELMILENPPAGQSLLTTLQNYFKDFVSLFQPLQIPGPPQLLKEPGIMGIIDAFDALPKVPPAFGGNIGGQTIGVGGLNGFGGVFGGGGG
jgi:hypothetical protein